MKSDLNGMIFPPHLRGEKKRTITGKPLFNFPADAPEVTPAPVQETKSEPEPERPKRGRRYGGVTDDSSEG